MHGKAIKCNNQKIMSGIGKVVKLNNVKDTIFFTLYQGRKL